MSVNRFAIINSPLVNHNAAYYIDGEGFVHRARDGFSMAQQLSEFIDTLIDGNNGCDGMILVNGYSTYLRKELRQVIDAEFGIGPMVGWRSK